MMIAAFDVHYFGAASQNRNTGIHQPPVSLTFDACLLYRAGKVLEKSHFRINC